jgi:predicted nucleic acid-binding protein
MIFATETIALGSLVLVDTSVWIDYFRKKDPAFSKVDNLMEEESVGICRLIIAELLQGAKGSKEIEIILDLPCVFPVINELSDTWEKAGLLANQLRGQGAGGLLSGELWPIRIMSGSFHTIAIFE